jgi:NarL family two-component system response regulator LiaR
LLRVLVCDDQEAFRTMLVIALALEPDIEIVGEAANGREAIERAAALQPDAMLLDLAMPELDGLAALPLILASSPGTAVIILSGITSGTHKTTAQELGAAAYIEKGATPQKVAAAIRAAAAQE